MKHAAPDAEQITRASKSNLALAFIALPRERRRDISVFYAFCRVVDDIADDPREPVAARRAALDRWRASLAGPLGYEPELAVSVRELMAKYQLPVEHFLEIIAGVEMDLIGTVFESFSDLRLYCHRVASVVGLVSIEIFGYHDPACRLYATELGLALQLTNILRDVGQDYANEGRIYLPRADMDACGYSIGALALRQHDEKFVTLMNFEASRAVGFYRSAEAVLPPSERASMAAAEIMRSIYWHLLNRMQRDHFQVFTKRYRLSLLEKAWCIGRVLIATRFRPASAASGSDESKEL